jgi:dTMP kinase
MKGKLIAFEGIDCAGKSTIIKRISNQLTGCKANIKVLSECMSPLSEIIKETLDNNGSPFIKTFLFASDRAWTYEKECLPALERGDLVFWDRYVDSAIVYRKVELLQRKDIIDNGFVMNINAPFIKADLTFFIDISPEVSKERALKGKRCEPYDIFFLKMVREEYGKLVNNVDYIQVNGEQDPKKIQEEIKKQVKERFKELFNEN